MPALGRATGATHRRSSSRSAAPSLLVAVNGSLISNGQKLSECELPHTALGCLLYDRNESTIDLAVTPITM
jgi:hypothetical protein